MTRVVLRSGWDVGQIRAAASRGHRLLTSRWNSDTVRWYLRRLCLTLMRRFAPPTSRRATVGRSVVAALCAAPLFNGAFMADVPQPSSDPKEADKKMRERVDKLVAQAAAESTGSIKLGGNALDYTVQAAFLPVVAEGFDGALGEPQAAVMTTSYVRRAPTRARARCASPSTGGPVRRRSGSISARSARSASSRPTTAACRRRLTPSPTTRTAGSSISTWSSSIRRTPGGRRRRASRRARRCSRSTATSRR